MIFERLAKKYGNIVGVICLVIAALLWGGEFVVAKDVFGVIPPNWTNVIRIFFATLMSIVLWRKQFKEATLRDWKRGAVCGILFGLAYALQSIGLDMIDAGLSAFISSAYIIMVPFMVWFVSKIRPSAKVFISAVVGIAGVCIMSVSGLFSGQISIGPGELLSIISAIGYGGAMVALDIYTEETSAEFLTGSQFIFTLIIALIFAIILEQPPQMAELMDGVLIAEFLYLIILGTFMTQLLFTFGIKYATASQAGVIFPLESVSAAFFGWLFLHEQLQTVHIIGAVLLIAAIVISSVEFKNKENEIIGG